MSKLLDQTCPHCGITEAKGAYCTKCFRRTEQAWVHPPLRSEAQEAATAALYPKENGRGGDPEPSVS